MASRRVKRSGMEIVMAVSEYDQMLFRDACKKIVNKETINDTIEFLHSFLLHRNIVNPSIELKIPVAIYTALNPPKAYTLYVAKS